MRIIEYSYPEKADVKNLAVALGYFDGVHQGHRHLLSILVKCAKEKGLTPCVFTFTNRPSKTKKKQRTIYKNADKIKIFKDLGIEIAILADFNSISNLSPKEFVEKVLIDSLSSELCVAGYNFKFGKNACGNTDDLKAIMRRNGKDTIITDEQTVSGKTVSSTEIRNLIMNRDLETANLLLGSPYFIRGTVEKGLGLGKSFGFPTVNTPISSDSPLQIGVYRSAVRIENKLFTGITNIGKCPTVGEREIHAETLIAGFNDDLYGKEIFVYLLEYLREEQKFSSVEELREQIYRDRDLSIKKNGDLKWLATGLNLQ